MASASAEARRAPDSRIHTATDPVSEDLLKCPKVPNLFFFPYPEKTRQGVGIGFYGPEFISGSGRSLRP